MEKLHADLSPDGLLTEVFADELTGKLVTKKTQDIEANVEYATSLRNNDDYWKYGMKQNFVHAAHIPMVVVHELLMSGCDVYRAPARDIVASIKKLGKEHLLTTRKRV